MATVFSAVCASCGGLEGDVRERDRGVDGDEREATAASSSGVARKSAAAASAAAAAAGSRAGARVAPAATATALTGGALGEAGAAGGADVAGGVERAERGDVGAEARHAGDAGTTHGAGLADGGHRRAGFACAAFAGGFDWLAIGTWIAVSVRSPIPTCTSVN